MSIVPKELLSLATNSLISLFLCEEPSCTSYYTKCTTTVMTGDDYNWALCLQCSSCNNIWWLCKTCTMRKKIITNMQLNRHQYANHNIIRDDISSVRNNKKTYQNVNDNAFESTDTHNDNNYSMEICNDGTTNDNNIVIKNDLKEIWLDDEMTTEEIIIINDIMNGNNEIHKINDICTKYYAYNINSSGNKYLITKMLSNEEGTSRDIFKRITYDEVICQLQLGKFCVSLSRQQQIEFGSLIALIQKSYLNNKNEYVCNLPISLSDIRRLYIDGKESYSKNLPIPNVYELKKHSYVSIIDCVADFLYANKHDLSYINDYRNDDKKETNHIMTIFGSKRVTDIINEANDRITLNNLGNDDGKKVLVLFLKMWSDDFDPNSSIKSNRQSVWVKTISIFCRLTDGRKVTYTYPIATAKKGVDHDEVDYRITNELELLRNGKLLTFFCTHLLQTVFVHADIYCILADQPERRSALSISAGNSSNHKRFGYLLEYTTLYNVIRSCNTCQDNMDIHIKKYKHNKNNTIHTKISNYLKEKCQICSNWMLHDDHTLLHYVPDKNYPTLLLDETGKLSLRKITRKSLQRCIDIVDQGLEDNSLSIANAKSFLKSEGFNQKSIDYVIDYSKTRISYDNTMKEDNNKNNNQSISAIIKDKEKHPTIYDTYKLPYSWQYGEDTQLFVDVPMHLLLLGIGKSVFTKVTKWLKLRMQSTEFKEITKGKLDVLKSYNIEWCKIIDYPTGNSDKFGGWVAENFLAFVRIANWFYSMITHLKEKKDLQLLNKPVSAWRLKENKIWLEIRGLPSDGNAKEIKDRVKQYMELNTPPPIIMMNNEDTTNILLMIDLLNEMISMILSVNTTYNDINYIELIIRKFLNCFDKLDKEILSTEQLPSWSTQYNYLSLLNIPNIMRHYGCCRNIWEGGIEGEGYLRKYKRELKHGLKMNWQIYAIKNLLQSNVFNKEYLEKNETWKVTLSLECRIYKQYTTFLQILNDNEVISAIYNNSTKDIYVCFRMNKTIKYITLCINWRKYDTYCNMKYYTVTAKTTISAINKAIITEVTGCILLPKLYENNEQKHQTYCIIFSDWRRI